MKRRDCLTLPLGVAACLRQPPAAAQGAAAPLMGRGFHLGEVLGRTLDDYRAMAAAGATLVRLGFALESGANPDGYRMVPQAQAELTRQLGFAAATGLRIVLVLRPPPEPDAALWGRATLQESLEALWRALARQLAGRKEIAAFDLVNEPHPPGLTFGLKQARWESLALDLARAVRAEDPARKLVVEPSPGARPMGFETLSPLPLDNVAYSVHMYEPFEMTHQRVEGMNLEAYVSYPGPATPGGNSWNADKLRETLRAAKQFGDRHAVEIYVGEFGVARWAPGDSRERYLSDLLSIFAEWGWSWTYHAWREWHGWDAEMGPDARDSQRRGTQPAFDAIRSALQQHRPATVSGR